MAEFSWAYIDTEAVVTVAGPTGSVQYRVADSAGHTVMSGTQNFVYHTASSLLAVTGNVEISGTLTANQYNINVIDKTVTNLSASGDTIFGDTADDTHQFTGSVYVNGPLSASTTISASAFYGDGSTLDNISTTSMSGAMGQFNTTSGLLITSGNVYLGDGASDVTIVASQLTASQGITVNGNANLNGNTALGNAAADVVTVASQLTASQGALFNEQVVIVDDKNLVFGSGGDSVIKYDEASSDRLVVSGSSTGLWLGGGAVIIDSPLTQVTTTMHVTGAVHITGSDAHLLVLHAKGTDNTRELVFRKDVTTDAGSLYINSSEHMFLRSEVSGKDIIFRTNSENPLRCFGSNHFVGIGNKTSANAQLDVDGNAIISGTLTTTDDINLLDDKKLNLGNSADALIEFDSGIGKLAISGSATGVELMGGGISLDYPGGTVASGSAAYGSFLAMNASNQIVLSTPNDPAITLKANGTHTITIENRTILLNTSSGLATCNLPAASTAAGLILTFKKILGGNNVVIDGDGSETIDGATTTTLTAVNQSVTMQCNGTSWFILSSYVP